MEWEDFIKFISVPMMGVVAYTIIQMQMTKADLAAYKTEVAKEYTSIKHLKDMESRIMSRISKLEDKLDRYANGIRKK